MRGGLLTLFAIAAFGLLLFFGARGEARTECEVCVTFGGRAQCHTAHGGDEPTAMNGAVTHICAALARGVTESMKCHGTPPSSARCRAL